MSVATQSQPQAMDLGSSSSSKQGVQGGVSGYSIKVSLSQESYSLDLILFADTCYRSLLTGILQEQDRSRRARHQQANSKLATTRGPAKCIEQSRYVDAARRSAQPFVSDPDRSASKLFSAFTPGRASAVARAWFIRRRSCEGDGKEEGAGEGAT